MKKIFLLLVLIALIGLNKAFAQWSQKNNFGGTARGWSVCFAIGPNVYLGIGYDGINKNDFWQYNPATNQWIQKASFPGTAREEAVAFSIDSLGYIGTGWSGSLEDDFWAYSPSTNTWIPKANFGGTARHSATGFSIGSKGYIGTGYDGSYRNDFWEYDPATNQWTQRPNFPGTARGNSTGFSIGPKGYIGLGTDGTFKQDFWAYDTLSQQWNPIASFGGTAREDVVGFSIQCNGKAYVGTGYDGGYHNDFWEYDTLANTWSQITSFPGVIRNGASGCAIGNKGYVGTGANGTTKYKDFWEYSPCIPPSINLQPISQTICEGNTATFNVSATGSNLTYQWYHNNIITGGNNDSLIILNTSVFNAGNYYCVISNICCSDTLSIISNTISLTVNLSPNPSIYGSLTYCSGSHANLYTDSTYIGYSWSTGSHTYYTSATTNNNPITVTVSDSNGCIGISQPVNVSVTAALTPTISGSLSYCVGDSTLLYAGNGYSTYLWSTGDTVPSIYVSSPGSFSVTVTDTYDCQGFSNVVSVSENTIQTPIITGDTSYCQYSNTTLSTSIQYSSYYWSNGDTTSTVTVANINQISVTVTASNGCSATSIPVTLIEFPKPSVIITAHPDSVCAGDSTLIIATGGSQYLWSNGTTTDSIHVAPPTTTTYSVTVTENGCSASSSITIYVDTGIIATVSPDSICSGDIATLTVSPGTNYIWSTGDTINPIYVSPLITTTYSVTVSNNSCSASTSVQVYVDTLPNAVVSNDIDTCGERKITLVASGGGTYLWSYNNETNDSIFVHPSVTTIYTVTVTNSYGCTDSDSVIVNIMPQTPANAGNDTTICLGDSITLTASGGSFYSWCNNLGNTASVIVCPELTTYYCVQVSALGYCPTYAHVLVSIDPPTPQLICYGDSICCTPGFSNYKWYNCLDIQTILDSSQCYNPIITGWYFVIASDTNGCSGKSDSCQIVIDNINHFNGNSKMINIYPNPAIDNITIEISQKSIIEIFNIEGQLLKRVNSSENKMNIDIFGLARGMYIIKVRNDKENAVKKFIKE